VVGDAVVVSHLPGLSAAGLALISSQKNLETDGARTAIAQHCAPSIDYVRYRSAFPFLNSATDISDGLVVDASHIADASSVAIEIDTKKITAHPDFEVISSIATNQEQALDFVLSGGEDHVLLGTTTNPEKCAGFTTIGRVVSGHGVFVDGKRRDGEAGYQHSW
jgi:thiamine-monophosphate kinase